MKKIAIIGAGISGLYFANLLQKNSDYNFTIFEKRSSLDMKDGYGIQLSVNSVKLLNQIGFKNIDQKEKRRFDVKVALGPDLLRKRKKTRWQKVSPRVLSFGVVWLFDRTSGHSDS